MTRKKQPTRIKWTCADDAEAQREGWTIFHTTGSHGPHRIERLDAARLFPNDHAARVHVIGRAACGSPIHKKALAVIKETDPAEWEALERAGAML